MLVYVAAIIADAVDKLVLVGAQFMTILVMMMAVNDGHHWPHCVMRTNLIDLFAIINVGLANATSIASTSTRTSTTTSLMMGHERAGHGQ